MRFPVYFKRGKGSGAGAAFPTLGTATDNDPTVSTGDDPTILDNDNVLHHKFGRPVNRVAAGYWYEGVGSIVTLPCKLWVLDRNSQKWYQAASGTLTNGQITYLKVTYLDDPPPVQVNLDNPQNGIDAMLVIADNTAGDGVFHFVMGPDAAIF